ncbi:phBC6A51 family helix-turn-helix protein [Methanosarcina acetivorans]|uniref:phBC6A51 family helix-turn-helix protein n=1 Tax=Methanosarcina acetivorans TaxID=2214 RepID=UPI00247B041C|nr:phBC6A51 family helix-turn-helix protein [Methanosarcina acetivorans]
MRKKAALLLSLGTKKYEDVASEVGVNERTLYDWRQSPIFLEEVDRLTLKNELATRAGLLRECLKGLDLKKDHIEGDKNTHLHYVQAIAELQGLTKQKVELSGNMGMEHSGGVVMYFPDNGRDPDVPKPEKPAEKQ